MPNTRPWFVSIFVLALADTPRPALGSHSSSLFQQPTASLLKKLGVSPRDAMVILGHSNISVTLGIYTRGRGQPPRCAGPAGPGAAGAAPLLFPARPTPPL